MPLSADRIAVVPRMRDWSALPSDLVGEVTQRLATVSDFVKLRAACQPWRSAVAVADLPPQFPWLLLPHDPEGDDNSRLFFDPVTGGAQALRLPRGARVCGSGHGWLVLGHDTDVLTLFNPLTGSSIPLPTFGAQGKQQHVWKAFLSSSPSSTSGCVVAVLVGLSQKLQLCRVGADSSSSEWSAVNTGLRDLVCDVKYLGDKLYSIGTMGALMICDAEATTAPMFVPPPPRKQGWFVDRCHLVDSSDQLLLVMFYTYCGIPQVFDRRDFYGVYRLEGGDEHEPLPRWVRAERIGNRALFVSELGSFSVSANHHHRRQGCCSRGDCIYVLNCRTHSEGEDGGIGGDVRVNVLDLKSGAIDVLHTKHDWLPGFKWETTWFLPNLLG